MDVMIDIETHGTRPDSAIIQIGACVLPTDPEESVGSQFLVSIDPESYDDQSTYHVDQDTINWWAKQSNDAKKSLEINRVKRLPLALDRLTEYFEEIKFERVRIDRDAVWGLGQFDLPILNYAYARTYGNDQTPWTFRQERDLRTLNYTLGLDGFALPAMDLELIKHRADHDAIKQAYMLKHHYATLGTKHLENV